MSAEDLGAGDGGAREGADVGDLAARIDLLEEENRRLREEYARARRTQYRKTAAGLGAVGVLAVAGGVLFPAERTVLFALGATGLFAGLLTYYVTPERFIAASVGEGVYTAHAENGDALASALGLADERVYVPLGAAVDDRDAALFLPQHDDYELPGASDLGSAFVVADEERRRGVSLRPTGEPLVREFGRALAGPLADDPGALADQLADGLVEQFELAGGATPDVDADGGRVSVAVADSTYGPVDRFDHPVASFLAVGLARGLDVPVSVETAPGGDRGDYLVTCTWPTDGARPGD